MTGSIFVRKITILSLNYLNLINKLELFELSIILTFYNYRKVERKELFKKKKSKSKEKSFKKACNLQIMIKSNQEITPLKKDPKLLNAKLIRKLLPKDEHWNLELCEWERFFKSFQGWFFLSLHLRLPNFSTETEPFLLFLLLKVLLSSATSSFL